MNYVTIQKAISAMKLLDEGEKLYVINQLLAEEDMSLMTIIYSEAKRLEDYRDKSRTDIGKLSRAGLDLAEKEIDKIPKIKVLNKRQLKAAQVKTLLSTRVYEGTAFEKKLTKNIDFSKIDQDWYKQCWALESLQNDKQHD